MQQRRAIARKQYCASQLSRRTDQGITQTSPTAAAAAAAVLQLKDYAHNWAAIVTMNRLRSTPLRSPARVSISHA